MLCTTHRDQLAPYVNRRLAVYGLVGKQAVHPTRGYAICCLQSVEVETEPGRFVLLDHAWIARAENLSEVRWAAQVRCLCRVISYTKSDGEPSYGLAEPTAVAVLGQ